MKQDTIHSYIDKVHVEHVNHELLTSPIVKSEEVQKWVHVRVKNVRGKINFEDMKQWCSHYTKYVCAVEDRDTEDEHFHIVLDPSEKLETVRDRLKDSFKFISGNKHYSIAYVKSEKILSYVQKEKDTVSKGFDESMLRKFEKMSFKKYSKEKIAKEIHDLEDWYAITPNVSPEELVERYWDIRLSYKQGLNRRLTAEWLDMNYYRKYPKEKKQLAKDFTYNQLHRESFQYERNILSK